MRMLCVIFNTERINKLILIKINHVSKQKVRYGHIYDRKCGLPQVKEELLNLDGRFCLVSVNQPKLTFTSIERGIPLNPVKTLAVNTLHSEELCCT